MKKNFTFLLCLILFDISASSQTLVASYPFNGNANDATGNGHNGTVNGATLTTDRFGNANSAYSFNGTNNNIIVPDAPDLRFTGPFTINTWVQPNGFYQGSCQGNTIINKGDYLTQYAWNLGYGDNILDGGNCNAYDPNLETFFLSLDQGGAEQYSYSPDIVKLGKWYMVTGVFDGTNIKTYVNGHLQGSAPANNVSGTPNTANLYIGSYVNGSSPYWLNGKIDDISIYNGALSDAQIFDTYVNDTKKPGSGNGIQLNSTGSLATSPYINVGSGFDFGTQPFTYETWVKRDVIATTQNNYGKALFIGDNNGSWGVGIFNNNTLFFTKIGINEVSSTGTIADTMWHHVAVVYTGTQIQFYIDGMAAGAPSYTDNFNNTSGNYFIGPRQSFGNSNGDQTLDGKVDETRIWKNVALTQTQIRDWMCKKITSAHPLFDSLFAYYKLDEGTDTIAYSTGGHPGVLINSPTWVTSGASIGDASAYNYSTTPTVTLPHPQGESLTATATSGSPAGIQLYMVNSVPNDTTGARGIGNNNRYFGVFQIGGTSPQYTATYNYNGNPYVTDKNSLRLYERANNADLNWVDAMATNNTTANTLTAAGQHTEYILGSFPYALPVTFINFDGKLQNDKAFLTWSTATEINNKGFDVEKSMDGQTFAGIGFVNGHGNSSSINNYNFTDNKVLSGSNYYRLKQIDLDGNFNYSSIIKIDYSKFDWAVLGSPLTNNSWVQVQLDKASDVSLQIISINGSVIQTINKGKIGMGTYSIPLNFSNASSGMYVIRLMINSNAYSKKIIK